ncbi:MAG: VWA domain-containing protein [Planctomycetota bacterium]
MLPTPIEVAVADIVNYHRHRLPLPRADEDVMPNLRFGNEVVAPGSEVVVQFGYTTAPSDDRADLPPLNLGIVIDRSGSMAEAGKLAAVKRALQAFVGRLRPADRVALVTYDNVAKVEQSSRAVDDGRWLRDAVAAIETGGGTNLHDGLMLGLREVAAHCARGTSSRVLLLTDGIANQGVTDPERILADASEHLGDDIDLSTIGVGREIDVRLLDRLARGGRGLFHFVADPTDIEKVFVQEHEALVAPVARSVRLAIELPRALELLAVIGHEFRTRGDTILVDLPNLNRGVTGVVMMRCRLRRDGLEQDEKVRVRCTLSYRSPARDGQGAVDECLLAHEGDRQPLLRDPEVRKNYTIAALAEGMHEMAVQCEARRWSAADRALQGALDFAREQFRSDDDADVARVRAMAEGHAKVLRRYVERFRDY